MNHLLKSQIHENFRLALPEGLKDLMSDISREVLRAQPQDLYQFITKYIEALLEARETLTIACQVCTDVCNCRCDPIIPELYKELRKTGLDDEDLKNAVQVIENHLRGDQDVNESVKEQSLLSKLLRKTSIDATQVPAVLLAVQKAFKRHILSHDDLMDILNENDNELSEAVRNTLKLEAEELFVSPHFKPCVTTVSSTSLAGSYVTLPKFRPYSAHDSELLSVIPEKEHLSIDYTKKASTDGIDATTIEIAGRKYILKENVKKDKATVLFDYHDHSKSEDGAFKSGCSAIDCTEASSGAASKPNKIEICENTIVLNESKATQSIDDNDNSIKDKSCSDEEVQESIENFESENESCFSSIAESLQDDI